MSTFDYIEEESSGDGIDTLMPSNDEGNTM